MTVDKFGLKVVRLFGDFRPASFDQAKIAKIKNLIDEGLEVNDYIYGQTFEGTLLAFVVNARNTVLAQWLLELGADPNIPNAGDETLLHLAVDSPLNLPQYRNDELIELLLKHGANVNAVSRNGKTPLMLAKKAKYVTAIQLLKKYGAKK